jgi:hypothetical protein
VEEQAPRVEQLGRDSAYLRGDYCLRMLAQRLSNVSLVQPIQKSPYLLRDCALRAKRHLASLLYSSIHSQTITFRFSTGKVACSCTPSS